MAEAIIFPVAKLILGKIGSAPGDLVYEYVSEKIKGAKSVKKDLEIIAKKLEAICAVLKDEEEEEKEQVASNANKIWLRDLKSVVYDIDDLLDEVAFDVVERRINQGKYGRQLRYCLSFSNPVISSFSLSDKIKSLRKKLENAVAKKNELDLNKRIVRKSSKVEIRENTLDDFAYVYKPDIVGREEVKDEIIRRVEAVDDDSKISVLPIVGMGGLGKTSLAKLVIQDIQHFDLKLWACVSNKFDIRKIIEDIIKDCSSDKNNYSLKNLQDLLNGKKYFLVLDDVWVDNIGLWNELMNVLKIGKAGSVILITTRNEQVASITQTMKEVNLDELPFSVCWSIFKQLAFKEGEEAIYKNLSNIGMSIVKKCCGNPLVVKSLGSLLRLNRDEKEWQRICNMGSFTELNHQYDKVMQLLKLSYDSLPSYLKPCFAYMSLYVKDLELSTGYIPYMWSALGLLPQSNGEYDIEVCGHTYLKELASKSLLQEPVFRSNGWLEECKMHDLLHDLALNVMGEELAVITQDKVTVSEFTRHIVWGYESSNSLKDMKFPKELLKAKNARTFRLGYKINHISQSFLRGILSNFVCLRILELEGSSFEELPSLIGNLKHMRYLDLSGNPIIQSLPNEICNLLNLEAFYLDGCEQLKALPRDIHRLQNLRSFTVTTCQESLLNTKFNLLSRLHYLWFDSCKSLESLWNNECVTGLNFLQALIIEDCPRLRCLPNMKLSSLQTLEINNCIELDLEKGGGLQGLEKLQTLSITGLPKLVSLPTCVQSAAASLQTLYIVNCVGLIEFPKWVQHFTSLRKLVIKDCQNILGFPMGFQHLTSLQELRIMNCAHLLQRCAIPSGKDFYLIRRVPKIWLNNVLYTLRCK